VAVSETNYGAVGYHDIIEPFGWLDVRRSLPDAKGPAASARRLQMHELYACLVQCLVQRWAYPMMPLANDIPCCLYDVKDLERNGPTAISARRVSWQLPGQGSFSSHGVRSFHVWGCPGLCAGPRRLAMGPFARGHSMTYALLRLGSS
jgi:hypothetical protein